MFNNTHIVYRHLICCNDVNDVVLPPSDLKNDGWLKDTNENYILYDLSNGNDKNRDSSIVNNYVLSNDVRNFLCSIISHAVIGYYLSLHQDKGYSNGLSEKAAVGVIKDMCDVANCDMSGISNIVRKMLLNAKMSEWDEQLVNSSYIYNTILDSSNDLSMTFTRIIYETMCKTWKNAIIFSCILTVEEIFKGTYYQSPSKDKKKVEYWEAIRNANIGNDKIGMLSFARKKYYF